MRNIHAYSIRVGLSSVNSYRKGNRDFILRLYFLTYIHSTIYFILHSTAILFYKSEKDYIKRCFKFLKLSNISI